MYRVPLNLPEGREAHESIQMIESHDVTMIRLRALWVAGSATDHILFFMHRIRV